MRHPPLHTMLLLNDSTPTSDWSRGTRNNLIMNIAQQDGDRHFVGLSSRREAQIAEILWKYSENIYVTTQRKYFRTWSYKNFVQILQSGRDIGR